MVDYDGSAENCIFCRIVRGDAPAYTFWESETHMAFLSIYPNTQGFSVVIPKEHRPSAVLELPENQYVALMEASKKAAEYLKRAFEDTGRVGMMVEGLGVDHAHTKLAPLHGTADLDTQWTQRASKIDTFFEEYPGYLSSHDAQRMDDKQLQETLALIRERNQ